MSRKVHEKVKCRWSKKKLKKLRRKQAPQKQQGASLKSISKRKLREQYDDYCMLCNHYEGDKITYHHIVWKSQGGGDNIENGSLLCEKCQKRIHKLSYDSYELQILNKKIQERKKFG